MLIECTATDLTKAGVVVDTMVAMFSEYCSEPFTYGTAFDFLAPFPFLVEHPPP